MLSEHCSRKDATKPLETGIKGIDVMCPLVAGGTVARAGELGAGTTVVVEELVRRLSGKAHRVYLFTLVPQWAERGPEFSYADQLKKEGFSEGTAGVARTLFFRAADSPWNVERLDELGDVDTVIDLAREMNAAQKSTHVLVHGRRDLVYSQ